MDLRKKCAKCGRRMDEGRRELECDQCVALASGEETIEVILELTLDELDAAATTLEQEASNMRHTGGGDWDRVAGILAFVAEAFRSAPIDERIRKTEDAHLQWRRAQE